MFFRKERDDQKSDGDRVLLDELSKSLGPMFKKMSVELSLLKERHGETAAKIDDFGDRLLRERSEHSGAVSPKWEYCELNTADPQFSPSMIGVFGLEGWELVAVTNFPWGGSINTQWHFKRRISELPSDRMASLGSEHESDVAELSEIDGRIARISSLMSEVIAKAEELGDMNATLLQKHFC